MALPVRSEAEALELIDTWAATQLAENPIVQAVEADGARRFVRLHSDEKGLFTIWLHVGQRTLHHETFLMPAPIENHAELFEHLLRRNHQLRGLTCVIGAEDAVYLEGRVPLDDLDADRLDEVLGMHYDAVERFFRPAMRIGFRSLYKG